MTHAERTPVDADLAAEQHAAYVRAIADAGWAIREVPVGYTERAGRSKVTGTVRGTARAVRDMTAVLR